MARRALGPATLTAAQAVTAVLEPGDRALLVGCSGGADSLALAAATVAAAARIGLPVAAAVVDHGLQPGSAAVAAQAAEQLRGLGIEDVVVERVDVRGPGGPEATARTARRAALIGRAAERSASVLLGHTRDDQAETVLLGLARGSGARSLAGMAGRRAEAGVDVLRPFLDLPRELTRTVCAEAGLTPWDDPHNASPDYRRPRVRHRVLPVLEAELGPGVAAALARTAALLRADADLLDELAAQAAPPRPDGHLSCDVAALPTALRTRVLRDWLRSAGAIDLDLTHVAAVDRLLTDWHGQRGVDIPRLRVRRTGRLLVADPALHP